MLESDRFVSVPLHECKHRATVTHRADLEDHDRGWQVLEHLCRPGQDLALCTFHIDLE
jgi:hypothetical protein